MDRILIQIPEPSVHINPNLLTTPHENLQSLAEELQLPQIVRQSARRRGRFEISILPDKAIVLIVKPTSTTSAVIEQIQFNPCKLLFGHNAQAILEQHELDGADGLLREFVSKALKNAARLPYLMPGDSVSCAHFAEVEVAINVFDDNRTLLRACASLSHRRFRKASRNWKEETITLSDSKKSKISIYCKDIEVVSKRREFLVKLPAGELAKLEALKAQTPENFTTYQPDQYIIDRITRFEVCFAIQKIALYFDSGCLNYKNQLVRFTLRQARDAFRRCMAETHGVFNKSAKQQPGPTNKGLAALHARLIQHGSASHSEVEAINRLTRNTEPRSENALKKDVRSIIASSSDHWSDIMFSDLQFNNQPNINLPQLETSLLKRREESLHQDPLSARLCNDMLFSQIGFHQLDQQGLLNPNAR